MITTSGSYLVKTAVDLSVPKADLMEREEVERRIGKRLLNASKQSYVDPSDIAVKGAVPGSLAGALMGLPHSLNAKSALPMGIAALLGGATGAGLGYLSGRARNKDIDFAKNRSELFGKSPAYRSNLYYDAVDGAMQDRESEAHYRALARNEREKQFHNDIFGTQMLRY